MKKRTIRLLMMIYDFAIIISFLNVGIALAEGWLILIFYYLIGSLVCAVLYNIFYRKLTSLISEEEYDEGYYDGAMNERKVIGLITKGRKG